MSMRLLVTGGAGFIGSNYIRGIVDGKSPHISEIIVLDKLTYAGSLSNLEGLPPDSYQFIEDDILNVDLLERIIPKVDSIINFAAESHVDRSILDPMVFVETNVKGVAAILSVIRKYPEKRFVQVSTDEVYGSISTGSWTEESPLLPNSPYAASKASADLLVRSYRQTYGLNLCITRSSNNYGRNQNPEKMIPHAITNLLRGQKVKLYGDGSNVREWLHVDDNCSAIHKTLLHGEPGHVYNIGSNQHLSNLELVNLILEIMGFDSSHIESVPDRRGHDFRYSVDFSKASERLGFLPKVEIKRGIEETIEWYRKSQKWWKRFILK